MTESPDLKEHILCSRLWATDLVFFTIQLQVPSKELLAAINNSSLLTCWNSEVSGLERPLIRVNGRVRLSLVRIMGKNPGRI